MLFRHAVDAPEGDGVVGVLDGPPAPGDGVVIVPLVRFLLNQATLAVNICNSKYKLTPAKEGPFVNDVTQRTWRGAGRGEIRLFVTRVHKAKSLVHDREGRGYRKISKLA